MGVSSCPPLPVQLSLNSCYKTLRTPLLWFCWDKWKDCCCSALQKFSTCMWDVIQLYRSLFKIYRRRCIFCESMKKLKICQIIKSLFLSDWSNFSSLIFCLSILKYRLSFFGNVFQKSNFYSRHVLFTNLSTTKTVKYWNNHPLDFCFKNNKGSTKADK